MSKQSTDSTARQATSGDVRKVLGDLDDAKVTEILALNPSLADLEDVAICMAGDHDVLAKSGHHVPVTAARIIELLVEEEEEPDK
jgi:hypothetical protein